MEMLGKAFGDRLFQVDLAGLPSGSDAGMVRAAKVLASTVGWITTRPGFVQVLQLALGMFSLRVLKHN